MVPLQDQHAPDITLQILSACVLVRQLQTWCLQSLQGSIHSVLMDAHVFKIVSLAG